MDYYLVIGLGLIAQGLFSARFIIQLTRSEIAGKVVSPVVFWQLSLLASFMLIIYGFLRNDIVIIGGQLISYYIYIRNLQLKNQSKVIPPPLRYLFFLIPVILLTILLSFSFQSINGLFNNPEIPIILLTYGTFGQLVFTFRFVIQWWHSEKQHESVFPPVFWMISLSGALLIIGYAIIRTDPVLFIGQFFGLLVYSRNLFLHYQPKINMRTKEISVVGLLKRYRMPALLGLVAIALLLNLNDWSVTESTEARYAQVSKEMVETGDYLHPQLMGIKHYHKPPLTYWITAAGYKIFGINSFGARFFMQIALLLQIVIVYGIGKLLLKNHKHAFLAALLYFALPGVMMSSRALTTDVYLCTFVLLSVYAWLKFAMYSDKRFLLLFYLALGLGFFTKGPVVFIFPVFIIAGAYLGKIRPTRNIGTHFAGALLMLVIGLGWFVYLVIYDHRFIDYFLINHTIERFATDVFRRSEPWWFFLAVVPAASFPWGIMLLTRLFRMKNLRRSRGILFFFWMIPPVVFFSLSQSKMLLYVLPVYAGIAIGALWAWRRLSRMQQKRWSLVQFIYHMILLGGLAMAPLIEPELTLSGQAYFLLVMTAAVIVALRFTPIHRLETPILAAGVLMYGLTLISPYIYMENPEMVKDSRNVVAFIDRELPETENILIFNRRLASIQFHTDRNIVSLYAGNHTLNREVQFEADDSWKNNLVNLLEDPEVFKEMVKPGNVLLIRAKYEPIPPFDKYAEPFPHITRVDRWHIYHY